MKNRQSLQESRLAISHGTNHPSGLEESELAVASLSFWMLPENSNLSRSELGTWSEPGVWERLLSFQQGWNACKDFYKINV